MGFAGERRSSLRRVWQMVRTVPGRLLLSLGLVLGFGAIGTVAYWSDSASLSTGTITSGSLDLQIGGLDPETGRVAWQAVGASELWGYSVKELDNVAPGESVAMDLFLRNAGSAPLTFTATGMSTTMLMNPHLTASTVLGGEARNTGTREAVDRAGSCTAGTPWWTGHVLSTTPVPVTPGDAPVSLGPGAQIRVCMLAGLAAGAPGSAQGTETEIRVVFRAKQAGAP